MQSRLKTPQDVIIVTHTFFYGASEALRDYFISENIQSLVYIGHPLLSEEPFYREERYVSGKKLYSTTKKRQFTGTLLSYVRDIMVTIASILRLPKTRYVYIGVNPLNACVGIILRILGRVDRVVFYAIDFIPKRSSIPLINYVYHRMESYAVKYSDICWNVSPRIAYGRRQFLDIVARKKTQIVVPIGVWEKEIAVKVKQTNDYRLIFVGHLLKKQGVQEVIRALPRVIKKLPSVTLAIIGGGEYEKSLRELVDRLSLSSHVKFLGWQSNQHFIQKKILQSDLSLATYEPSGKDTTNFSYYADPTKIKTYLSCGVPLLMTDVSYNAKALIKAGVAAVVPYDKDAIASSIIRIFQDQKTLFQMKKKSIQYAQNFRWDRIFADALHSI